MILRRVTEHVKAQNWFTVGIDFVIVVVGVFVGLQVQDWNDSRKERVEESVLMVRLFEETRSLIDAHERELASLRSRAEVLIGANPVSFSQAPSRAITGVLSAMFAALRSCRSYLDFELGGTKEKT